MQWKLTLNLNLKPETQREILKKHWIKKEPFSKVSIHEMHIPEMVENFLESGMEIRINTVEKEIMLLPIME